MDLNIPKEATKSEVIFTYDWKHPNSIPREKGWTMFIDLKATIKK